MRDAPKQPSKLRYTLYGLDECLAAEERGADAVRGVALSGWVQTLRTFQQESFGAKPRSVVASADVSASCRALRRLRHWTEHGVGAVGVSANGLLVIWAADMENKYSRTHDVEQNSVSPYDKLADGLSEGVSFRCEGVSLR
jgi:hypothetical protein